jgi:hypothetical protein
MTPSTVGDSFDSSLTHAADTPSEPDRLGTIEARARRIRELKDELFPLIEAQRGDIWEMNSWNWSHRRIARTCGLSQPQVFRVLHAQR